MINILDTESSDRMLIVKDVSPVVVEIPLVEIPLENEVSQSSEEINKQNMKQVDSSSGYQDEQNQLHLGILEEQGNKSQQRFDENSQKQNDEVNQQIQNAQINLIVLGEAVAERKSINFKAITSFMQSHIKYYSKHMDVLIDLESSIVNRLTKQREFIKQIYGYFYALNQTQVVNPSSNLSHLFLEEDNKPTYQKIVEALKNITIARGEFEVNTGSSSIWISNQVLLYLHQLIVIHENSLSHYSHQILKYKMQVDEKLKLLNILFKQIEQIVVFGTSGREIDLLSQEVNYFEIAKNVKNLMIEWGTLVNTFWFTSIKGELSIISQLKKYIDSLFQSVGGLFQQNEKLLKARQYWLSFNPQQQIQQSYDINFIISDQNHSMIKKHLQKGNLKNQDFEKFVRLQHQIQWIGNPHQIKSVLILKKFKCKLIVSKNKYQNIIIYSSVDGFVVFVCQQSQRLLNTMNLKSTVSNRVDYKMIEIKERKPGFFKDSWNKAELQFDNSNEAEQFLVFLAQSMEEIEGIIS